MLSDHRHRDERQVPLPGGQRRRHEQVERHRERVVRVVDPARVDDRLEHGDGGQREAGDQGQSERSTTPELSAMAQASEPGRDVPLAGDARRPLRRATTAARGRAYLRVAMIEVHDLHKRYGDTLAVDGLSFAVQPGPRDRLRRAERRRQVDHHAPDPRPRRARRRRRAGRRPALRVAPPAAAPCRRAARRRPAAPGPPRARPPALAGARATACRAGRVDEVLELVGLAGRRPAARARLLARHAPAARASPRRCSATRRCCCSTSRSTASTPRASAGSAASCASSPPRAARCSSRAT